MDNLRHVVPTDAQQSSSSTADSYSLRLRRLSRGVRARLTNRPFSCDVDSMYCSTAGSVQVPNVRHSVMAKLKDRVEGEFSNGTKDAQDEFTFGQSVMGSSGSDKSVKRKGSIKERLSFLRRPAWCASAAPKGAALGGGGLQDRRGLDVSVSPAAAGPLHCSSAKTLSLSHGGNQTQLTTKARHACASQPNCCVGSSSPPVALRYGSSHFTGAASEPGNRNSACSLSSSSLTTTVRPSSPTSAVAGGSSSSSSSSSTGDNAHCTFSINCSIKREQPCRNPRARSPQLKQRHQLIVDACKIAYSCDRFASSGRSLGDDKALPACSTVSSPACCDSRTGGSRETLSCSVSSSPLVVDAGVDKNNSSFSSSAKQQRPLKRAKAVDLGTSDAPHHSTRPFSAPQSQERQSKRLTRKEARKGFTKASNDSILRKLIAAGGKAFSEDSSLKIMSSVTSMVTRTDNADVSFASVEEQRGKKQFFCHYDCHSICADYGPLLNPVSWKTPNREILVGPLGPFGSSCSSSRSYTTQKSGVHVVGSSLDIVAGSVSAADSEDVAPNAPPSDPGDGKCNDLVSSGPYFRNELGGEPTRHISLGTERYRQRWVVQDLSGATDLHANSTNCNASTTTTTKSADSMETWHRIPSAAEACVLENLGNVYLGGRLCAFRQPQLVIEYVDHGAFYYRHCFAGKAHQNYFGIDENLGPIAVSIARDKLDAHLARQAGLASPYSYRLIVRFSDLSTLRGSVPEESLPSYQAAKEQLQGASCPLSPTSAASVAPSGPPTSSKIPVKEILELMVSDHVSGCLRLAVPLPRTEEMLLKLDEQAIYTRYKVGVLLCKAGQSTEEHMYNNEFSTPAFDEFLDILGQRIRLKGFEKYKGGLDSKGDSTGTHSVYTSHQQYEIMFHVSTMLPFTPSNRQQLARKRHIGNDIVTIVFQESGAAPFNPQTMRSQFQHVFVIVRVFNPNTDNVQYSVAVTRYRDVPPFGPRLPADYKFPRSQEFREFLLTKVINAENAVHVSAKFAAMAARTRKEFIRELAENHCISQPLESSSAKITSKILGSKRKDRPKPKVFLEAFNRGAIVWDVQVLTELENFSLCCTVDCFLAISADYVVLIERSSEMTLFCTATHSVIGWTSHGNSLKLYYDHADVVILRTVDDDDGLVLNEIVSRLKFVTKGCETQEMLLRHTACLETLDFRVQYEGIVDDVDMYGRSWSAGLRQGSRIVEICKVSVASLLYPKMLELLKGPNCRILVIPPMEDGSPRRGCEDPHCPAVRGEISPLVSTDWVSQPGSTLPNLPGGHSPPSYDSFLSRVGCLVEPSKDASKALSPNCADAANPCSSKSLDELRSRRSQVYGEAAVNLDSGFDSTRNSADYHSTTTSSLSSEDRWYQSLKLQAALKTQTLSSSSSAGSSELSSEATAHLCKASVSSSLLRPSAVASTSAGGNAMNTKNLSLATHASSGSAVVVGCETLPKNIDSAPPLPPRNYKCAEVSPTNTAIAASAAEKNASLSQQHLADLSRSSVLSTVSGEKDDSYTTVKSSLSPRSASESASQDVKYSSLVDLANKAMEGVQQMAISHQSSPQLTSYNLMLQTSRRKIALLEDRVQQLCNELSAERQCKRSLEMEISQLNDQNKALSDELKATKEELQHFNEWLCSTVENPAAYLSILNDGS